MSSDVLEHIHEDEADKVVSELVRVSRRHLFLSISLKPHTKVGALCPVPCALPSVPRSTECRIGGDCARAREFWLRWWP